MTSQRWKEPWTMRMSGLVTLALIAGCGDKPPATTASTPSAPAAPASTTAPPSVDIERIDAGVEQAIAYLKGKQNPDGSYGKYPVVGMAALVVTAMAESHLKLREKDGPAVARTVAFVLGKKQPDGGLYDPEMGLTNYNTSLAIIMLAALENPKYLPVIDGAQKFIVGIQRDEQEGSDPKSDMKYGGIGYTKDDKNPDLSNTQWAVESLKAAEKAGAKVDPEVYRRVLIFIKRCQNDGEVNDMEVAAVVNDGGAIYRPGDSKAGKVTLRGRVGWRSYGSMTYAMLKSYIHANLKKDAPAVKAALRWIGNNYTLDENPGMGKQGYYYYFTTFARSLAAYGQRTITDRDGKKHDWAAECAAKLLSLQKPEGHWVNTADRWYEGDPVLVTAYAVMALNVCRDQLRARSGGGE